MFKKPDGYKNVNTSQFIIIKKKPINEIKQDAKNKC